VHISKKTNTDQQNPVKETCKRDLQQRPTRFERDQQISKHLQNRTTYFKNDVHTSKETNTLQKRPTYFKRDHHTPKETKRRDLKTVEMYLSKYNISNETYISQKRPIQETFKRDLY